VLLTYRLASVSEAVVAGYVCKRHTRKVFAMNGVNHALHTASTRARRNLSETCQLGQITSAVGSHSFHDIESTVLVTRCFKLFLSHRGNTIHPACFNSTAKQQLTNP
jgi:hypothetical protein